MKKLIIANWKMNPRSIQEARNLIAKTEHRMRFVSDKMMVVVCPPFTFLPAFAHFCHAVELGAQNVSWLERGALTGEVSAEQLKMFKVNYVILGHSERRLYLGETDSIVNAKIVTALKYKLVPIVCLGTVEDDKKPDMKKIVTKQFLQVIKNLNIKQLQKIIFVYEPSWAISSMEHSAPATGEHVRDLILHIEKLLAKEIGTTRARNMLILYGGTVNRSNVSEFAKYPEIGGALVGAASLDSENFWQIIKEFDRESVHRA